MCRDVVSVRREFESQGKSFKVTFLSKGDQSTTIDCPDDQYILDAAEAVGLDLPATCRGTSTTDACRIGLFALLVFVLVE
jgi:hypothetical protein